ncbi:cytochrome c-type protein Shp [endosymbiont of unidentified scaly snail isolate Monju]|nr:cytochrome c-type protein Shp [endosymbiont of unidentified scaly snail isolate Monju]
MKTGVFLVSASLVLAPFGLACAAGADREGVIQQYVQAAEGQVDVAAGERLWMTEGVKGRSCTTCHGRDLTRPGKHKRTGKRIEPMAPSVNPKRFTDPKKVAKWFRRNCKWTLGRECTAAEKANLLSWLNSL